MISLNPFHWGRPPDSVEIPLFPLHAVLFPGGLLPLKVFEARYLDMISRCIADDAPFGVCRIVEGDETGAPALPEAVGCLAGVTAWDMPQQGILQLTARGLQRYAVIGRDIAADGLITARVRLLPAEAPQPLPEQHRVCATVLRHVIDQVGADRYAEPFDFDDLVWVGYRLAESLPLRLPVRQNLLEMNDSLVRIEILHRFLTQQGLAA